MKVLLTGGTGFLGKNVARALAEAGHDLRVLARGGSNLDSLPPDAEVARGDVTDAESLRRAASGCAAIFHLAALVKMWVPDRARFDEVNVGGLENALAAAESASARLVYTSSFMAVGPTGPVPADESQRHPSRRYCNDYERTKAAADRVAMAAASAGRDIVILYPGVVYGPGDLTDGNLVAKMVADHLAGRFPGFVGAGDRLWSYAFVPDVARGHAEALVKGRRGERYFLGGENATQQELFRTLEAISQVPAPKVHIPYAAAALLGHLLVGWAELTGHPPLLTPGVVEVFKQHWAYSSAKAEQELGYRRTSLEAGLRQTVHWLRDAGHAS
jgi:NAD+-dependent farnesol dehydrogenase